MHFCWEANTLLLNGVNSEITVGWFYPIESWFPTHVSV